MRVKGPQRISTLPTDPKERKKYPIFSGVLAYFPDAIAAVAHVSYVGNEQHNPGEPLHWARGKSMDQEDTLVRHLMESGGAELDGFDADGMLHSVKAAWRALAKAQLEIEALQDQGRYPANAKTKDLSTASISIPREKSTPDFPTVMPCLKPSPSNTRICDRPRGHEGTHAGNGAVWE